MLKQRILTALVLLPLALFLILWAPLWLFDLAVLAMVAGLAAEFGALCLSSRPYRTVFIVLAVGGSAAALLEWEGSRALAEWLLLAATLAWMITPLWFVRRQRLPAAVKALFGLLILGGAAAALHQLKAYAPDGRWVLLVFLLVWAADVGAYAAGRLFGRHKLARTISPGKTWEGFCGGLLLAMAIGAAAGKWMLDVAPHATWLLLLAALIVISVVGDLAESLLKRQAGVKDSGRLLPGHGGVLDRLDSLLAAAPLLVVFGAKIGIFGGVSDFWP